MGDIPDYDRTPAPLPAPPGAVSSHDLVAADLAMWGAGEFTDRVIELLAERKAYGLEKYTKILHKDNGRPHDQDTEDEVLDLAVYLRTWIDHEPNLRPVLAPIYRDTLWSLVTIANLRHNRTAPDYWMKMIGPMVEIDALFHEGVELSEEDTGAALVWSPEVLAPGAPEVSCGGHQKNGKTCIQPLDEDSRCTQHGERVRP